MRMLTDEEVIDWLSTQKGPYSWNDVGKCPGAMLLQSLYPDADQVTFGYDGGHAHKADGTVERVRVSDRVAEAFNHSHSYEMAMAHLRDA